MLLEGLTLSDTVRDLASWRLLKNGQKGAVVRASPSQDITQYLLIYFLGRSLGSHPTASTASTADRQDLSSLEIKNLLAGTSLPDNYCVAGTSLPDNYCVAGTSLEDSRDEYRHVGSASRYFLGWCWRNHWSSWWMACCDSFEKNDKSDHIFRIF